ncbi:energy transducer TonB [Chitinophaga sp. NPDC101104]|uniref:energy transducer TonB n=1 Tax=Chitinophaga sp. NPDC101104 TaxID=3390561 RepID=UPI003CFE2800
MNTSQMPKPDFLDILFNSRNKDYGAYDLRRRYDRRVRNAVASMAGLVIVSVGSYLWATQSKAGEVVLKPYVPPIELKTVELPPEEKFIPPPPRTVEPPAAVASVRHVTVRIVEDDKVDPADEVKKMDELTKEVAIGTKDMAGKPGDFENPFDGEGGTPGVVEAPKVKELDAPLTFVEVMPEFPGGEKAMYDFLNNHTRYPAMASENGIEGTVYLKFVVGTDGTISNVEVSGRKLGAGLEEEAIRVIKKMPKWKAGRQNGRNVPVWFNMPFRFHLNQ